MGQTAIGSCLGAWTAGCCGSLLARDCGDFRSSPRWIPSVIDSSLILLPIFVRITNPSDLLLLGLSIYLLVLASIYSTTALLLPETDRSHFGIKLALLLLGSIGGTAICWYQGIGAMTEVPSWLASVCLGMFGFFVATILSDFGMQLSEDLVQYLDKIRRRETISLLVQFLVFVLSVCGIAWTLTTLNGYMYCLLSCGVVFLSVYRQRRGTSVLSASLVLTGTTLVASSSMQVPIVLATIYNNLLLHGGTHPMGYEPLLPPLDGPEEPEARSKNALNVCAVCAVFYYVNLDTIPYNAAFLLTALITAVWILIAPRIFTGRIFS